MLVKIDQNLCVGCGTCKAICPEVFEVNEDGKAYILENADVVSYKSEIENAIESCPVQSISIED